MLNNKKIFLKSNTILLKEMTKKNNRPMAHTSIDVLVNYVCIIQAGNLPCQISVSFPFLSCDKHTLTTCYSYELFVHLSRYLISQVWAFHKHFTLWHH